MLKTHSVNLCRLCSKERKVLTKCLCIKWTFIRKDQLFSTIEINSTYQFHFSNSVLNSRVKYLSTLFNKSPSELFIYTQIILSTSFALLLYHLYRPVLSNWLNHQCASRYLVLSSLGKARKATSSWAPVSKTRTTEFHQANIYFSNLLQACPFYIM